MTKLFRRFNYTQRTTVARHSVHIDVEPDEGGACVAVVRKLNLSDQGEHAESAWNAAQVFLEARRPSTQSWSRHLIGTVSEVKASLPKRLRLDGFDEEGGIIFRVKVVDGESRLLAEGDHIHAGEPQNAEIEPLIFLVPADLGEELWRVVWDDSYGPRVAVNSKKIPNWSNVLTRDPLTRGLVLPQIVRQILPRVAAEEQQDEWVQRWSEFAKELGHGDVPDPDDDEAVEEWVDEVTRTFAANLKFASLAEAFIQKGLED